MNEVNFSHRPEPPKKIVITNLEEFKSYSYVPKFAWVKDNGEKIELEETKETKKSIFNFKFLQFKKDSKPFKIIHLCQTS
jgi:hypothetical protein